MPALHLARWLGPWAPDHRAPENVTVEEHAIPGLETATRPMRCLLFRPRGKIRGAILLAPGLHPEGPAEARTDRFCRILASSGIAVLGPFLPDFMQMQVRPALTHDLDRALHFLLDHPEWLGGKKPALFSISFGSLPALRLLGASSRRGDVGRAIVFGGYANWEKTVEFCLTGKIDGRVHGARDPLNQPVVFVNLLDHLDGVPDDRPSLVAAWRTFVDRTWGRPEMKEPERFHSVARDIAANLEKPVRDFFLLGCGVEGDGHGACMAALARADFSERVDPRSALPNIRCPITLLHGLDDDVIPFTQAEELHAALKAHTQTELLLTGLVDHSRSAAKIGAGIREARTLLRICRVLARPT
jgi:pimeloyl-ACP methyl ester carboxylesterase